MKIYNTIITDQADADLERIYLRLLRISLSAAVDWQTGFEVTLASLTSLPHRCPKARDGGRYPGVTVRQLYFGRYRLIFHVIEAVTDAEDGVVHVLRVLHGAQSLEQADKDA